MNSGKQEITPVKVVKPRGRPPKLVNGVSDFCRLCKTNFKTQLGNFSKQISTENIYNISKKSEAEGTSLNDLIVKILEIQQENSEVLSSRVCSKCALKIRNAAKLYSFVRSNVNVPHADVDAVTSEPTVPPAVVRIKRLYHSPGEGKKKRKNSTKESPLTKCHDDQPLAPRKNLEDQRVTARTVQRSLSLSFHRDNDNNDSHKENYDPFPLANIQVEQTVRSKELEVDVYVNYPAGVRVTHIDDATASRVIKNIALNNWKAAVNIMFKNPDCKVHLQQAIRSSISSEFKEYCHSDNSVLKYSSPSELASFSNNLVHVESSVFCPLWTSAVEGALGVSQGDKKKIKATNVFALCTGSAARFRNNRMSAYAHRVSTILLHSGAKSRDFMRLNRLGISMSHSESIKKQKEMGKSHDIKVLMWKNEAELNKKCVLLLEEIRNKQVPVFEEDDMELEVTIHSSESTLTSYNFYSKEVYEELNNNLFKNRDFITGDELESSIRSITRKGISHPKYRYV
jgi:hypothetical protein